MNEAVAIGRNIKSVRSERNMTQRSLSGKTGISISQLSAYENGKQMPGLPTLAKISTALATSLDRLYFGASSEAFLNRSDDFGETVVNCFLKLREIGVVRDVRHSMSGSEGSATMPKCSYEISRLFKELGDYEFRKDYYPDGNAYIEQICASVANEINGRSNNR